MTAPTPDELAEEERLRAEETERRRRQAEDLGLDTSLQPGEGEAQYYPADPP